MNHKERARRFKHQKEQSGHFRTYQGFAYQRDSEVAREARNVKALAYAIFFGALAFIVGAAWNYHAEITAFIGGM